ncbi:MAG: flagellar hook-length control protein FliK, partial [Gallionellaceae bacterium]|nr:flagellar hook-length control protein FliK [Gallionellaceae bacterium]
DVIELQVMSLQPRLTFSLSASTNPLSSPEQLSTTSRLLSTLSQQPLEKAYVRSTHSEPLMVVADTPPDTKILAGKLHESLSQSGLFYEAHQAQWIAGSRSTAQLLQEPQNLLTDPVKTAIASLSNAGSQSDNPMGIPNSLQPLVQQQLNALETRQVLWQGQVWPNQNMDWEIHEETPRSSTTREQEENGQWATQIRLDLPHLGEVAAMLRFGANGLSITLDAGGAQTRKLFGVASSQLTAALAERGIKVSSTLVASHDKS